MDAEIDQLVGQRHDARRAARQPRRVAEEAADVRRAARARDGVEQRHVAEHDRRPRGAVEVHHRAVAAAADGIDVVRAAAVHGHVALGARRRGAHRSRARVAQHDAAIADDPDVRRARAPHLEVRDVGVDLGRRIDGVPAAAHRAHDDPPRTAARERAADRPQIVAAGAPDAEERRPRGRADRERRQRRAVEAKHFARFAGQYISSSATRWIHQKACASGVGIVDSVVPSHLSSSAAPPPVTPPGQIRDAVRRHRRRQQRPRLLARDQAKFLRRLIAAATSEQGHRRQDSRSDSHAAAIVHHLGRPRDSQITEMRRATACQNRRAARPESQRNLYAGWAGTVGAFALARRLS